MQNKSMAITGWTFRDIDDFTKQKASDNPKVKEAIKN
jgi:hypothetical protein